jgi:ParB-like chromosome segregation protein Spo0J
VTHKKKQPSHIRELIQDRHNRRKHTPRNVGMIVDSLHKVGTGRSIVIDENNEILAGNATVDAAAEAGITRVRVVEVDGNELIAVKRTGLSTGQKRALAIFDNRTGELAEWNTDQLLEDMQSGEDLSAFFYDEEVTRLLKGLDDAQPHIKHVEFDAIENKDNTCPNCGFDLKNPKQS